MENYYEIYVTSPDVIYSEFNVPDFRPTQCQNRQDYRKCNAKGRGSKTVGTHVFCQWERGQSKTFGQQKYCSADCVIVCSHCKSSSDNSITGIYHAFVGQKHFNTVQSSIAGNKMTTRQNMRSINCQDSEVCLLYSNGQYPSVFFVIIFTNNYHFQFQVRSLPRGAPINP